MKNETVFRDKSIERVASPDQLNDYIRLSDPGIWFILSAIIVILAGACVFGVFGQIDSTVPAVGVCREGQMVCLVKKEYGGRFTQGLEARIDGRRHAATLVSEKPVTVAEDTDAYALYLGDLQPGEWVYEVAVDGTFADGAYEAVVVTERTSPLSFLVNKP